MTDPSFVNTHSSDSTKSTGATSRNGRLLRSSLHTFSHTRPIWHSGKGLQAKCSQTENDTILLHHDLVLRCILWKDAAQVAEQNLCGGTQKTKNLHCQQTLPEDREGKRAHCGRNEVSLSKARHLDSGCCRRLSPCLLSLCTEFADGRRQDFESRISSKHKKWTPLDRSTSPGKRSF